jgi:hypothetical protein
MVRKQNIQIPNVVPNAPVAEPPAELGRVSPAVAEKKFLDWERGFKVGRGLPPHVARPYAEGTADKRPSELVPVDEEGRADFDAGFVAGFRSQFTEDQGASRG